MSSFSSYGVPADRETGPRRSRQLARFLRSFVAHPRTVGALLPTSRRAVSDTLDLTRVRDARLIVEFGAGSGVYTRALLERMDPAARLLAFEVDEQLSTELAAEVDDPRLSLITASAQEVERHLQGAEVDILVSALPFTSLPAAVRRDVLDVSPAILSPQGEMLVLQYSPLIKRELSRRFGSVEQRISPLNLPPAFLFRCTAPMGAR